MGTMLKSTSVGGWRTSVMKTNTKSLPIPLNMTAKQQSS